MAASSNADAAIPRSSKLLSSTKRNATKTLNSGRASPALIKKLIGTDAIMMNDLDAPLKDGLLECVIYQRVMI